MTNIHFIGAGQMAEAIVRAARVHVHATHSNALHGNTADSNTTDGNAALGDVRFTLEDIDPQRVSHLTQTYQLPTLHADNALAQADLVVIAVRPQDDIPAVAQRITQLAPAHSTLVSIVAGVTLAQLTTLLGDNRAIARVIPNTLTDTGYGYSGVTLNRHAKAEQLDAFFSAFGKVLYLEERLIDVFTGFGVAGPNYVYYFIESLTDAGVLAGLPRALATQVVQENLIGAVEMLRLSQKHPRQLLDINNSPAGVGMHGLYELNNSDFAAGLQRSVLAAVKRTTALANSR